MDRSYKHISLEDCLRYFTASETVNDVDCSGWVESPPSNLWYQQLPQCTKVPRIARKKLCIARAPTILCLHIRRLVSTEFGLGKVRCHIQFPLQLDLSPYCSFDLSECAVTEETVAKMASPTSKPLHCSSLWSDLASSKYKSPLMGGLTNGILAATTSCIGGGDTSYTRVPKLECDCTAPDVQGAEAPTVSGTTTSSSSSGSGSSISTTPLLYSLVSVVEHSGNHAGGHYTVYRKDTTSQKWFHISDDRVTPVEDVRNSNAYMLFYEKI